MTPIRNGQWWADAPPSPPDMTAVWIWRVVLFVGALIWFLAAVGVRSLFSQVNPVVTLDHGQATTIVRNPARESMQVTVKLHFGVGANLDREVRALVSPSAFTLAPGETQTLRLKLREPVAPNTVLRLLTCLTPTSADQPAPGSDRQPVAKLVMRSCLNSKVLTGGGP